MDYCEDILWLLSDDHDDDDDDDDGYDDDDGDGDNDNDCIVTSILQVKVDGRTVDQLPLRLVSYWKAEPNQYDYRLDYTYQGSSMHPPSVPLSNLQLALQLPGTISDVKMHSLPAGTWWVIMMVIVEVVMMMMNDGGGGGGGGGRWFDAIDNLHFPRLKETRRVTWKLSDISDMSENGSTGNVKAKFDMTSPDPVSSPDSSSSTSSPLSYPLSNVAFLCEGATMSGLDFELSSSGYRLSLVKKRFSTG